VNEALWLVECGRLLEGKAGLRKIRLHDLRQHADFLIMPTTNWKQQFGGARAF
jgi:hypothetical protein